MEVASPVNNRKRYEISETYKVEGVCGRGNEREDSGWQEDKACGGEVREDEEAG